MDTLKKPVIEQDARRAEHIDHSHLVNGERGQTQELRGQTQELIKNTLIDPRDTIRAMPAVSHEQVSPSPHLEKKTVFSYLDKIERVIEDYYQPQDCPKGENLLELYKEHQRAEQRYANLVRFHLNLDIESFNNLQKGQKDPNRNDNQEHISRYNASLEEGLAKLSAKQKDLLELSYMEVLTSKFQLDNERNSLKRTIDKQNINNILIAILGMRTMIIKASIETGREHEATIMKEKIDNLYRLFNSEISEARGENEYRQVYFGEKPASKMQESISTQERIISTLGEIKLLLEEMLERGILTLYPNDTTAK